MKREHFTVRLMSYSDRGEDSWFPSCGWDHIEDSLSTPFGQLVNSWMGVLYGCARHAAIGYKRPTFVELGVMCGATTIPLILAAKETDGFLYSIEIDPSHEEEARKRVRHFGAEDRWAFICGDSREIKPIKSHFLYVDADHTYQSVTSDMRRHGLAVVPGGLIVLDDYHMKFPGKVRWVQERWLELKPLTIGPYVIFERRREHEETFRREYAGEDYNWYVLKDDS